jgi:DNA repair exonuclease SbcCD ATPase subunit
MSEANQHNNGLPNSPSRGPGGPPAPPPGGAGDVELQVKRIQEKLQQLLRQRESLLKENSKLKEEIRQLQQAHSGHSNRVEQLQQQVEILRTTKGEMSEAEKRVLEKRLGQYIREIDRCIALLSG